ncbi:MAG: serine/threonine-protein phosphatase [Treponema sp.]|jgi:sigma-B regulation protein RsbU (phosphoserine phosphatase)|nr:serine/threonine-protein phosphatase [Treponema sp.]
MEKADNFSPLQVGYIAHREKPVGMDEPVKAAIDVFDADPELKALPVTGKGGEVKGVVSRNIKNNLAISADYRIYQRELEKHLIPFKGTIEATNHVSRIVEANLKVDQGKFPAWYKVLYKGAYYGTVSLQQMLEYMNTLRSLDLSAAGKIQQYLLEHSLVEDGQFDALFYNRMTHEVGGDFFRVFKFSGESVLAACFDASGKNITGALATMALGACFAAFELFEYGGVAEMTSVFLNRLVKQVVPPGSFVAALLVYLDFASNTIKIHNCGFSPVMVFLPQAGKWLTKTLMSNLPPLGIEYELDFGEVKPMALNSGLRFAAYSDGLTDMASAMGERYGEERAGKLIRSLQLMPHKDVKAALDKEIKHWVGDNDLPDDITVMDLRLK